MAKRMYTSRAALDRLLDSEKNGVTLDTLSRAALPPDYIFTSNWSDRYPSDQSARALCSIAGLLWSLAII